MRVREGGRRRGGQGGEEAGVGVQAESEEIKERHSCTACKGTWGCMALGVAEGQMSTDLGLQAGRSPLTALLSPALGWYSPTCWDLS